MSQDEPTFNGIGLFDEVEKYTSISPLSQDYQIVDLCPKEIEYLKSIIESLEKDKNVILCARGDSLDRGFSTFIDKKLYDFFIVGSKAKFFKFKPNNSYHHALNDATFKDNKKIIKKVNKELRKIGREKSEIEGQLSDEFITYLEEQDESYQIEFKLLLLSFLHNKGADRYFKDYSGLVSLTRGQNKYHKAKHFAIAKNKCGFIFIYILDNNLRTYVTAEELQKKLLEFGVKWFNDNNSEIMIQNGLFPHNMIGFFEIRNDIVERFILNPWFHSQIKEDLKSGLHYNYKNGVLIDQTGFFEALKRLGYTDYFIRNTINNNEYIVDMNNRAIKPILKKQ